jgi:hypothetical protein
MACGIRNLLRLGDFLIRRSASGQRRPYRPLSRSDAGGSGQPMQSPEPYAAREQPIARTESTKA